MFASASAGVEPAFVEAWTGSLAYTLQLYFDFSGYSDMAIGLARLFGVRLPVNFNSPYKADNIIDFWRRWHITLSRFLRDYLYIPLGGNRKGKLRRYNNLLLTMLLGGLWHGAGWTFVIWGGLHGLYLIIAHGWHAIKCQLFGHEHSFGMLGRFIARTITFLAVVVSWVFFRADSANTALSILAGMSGLNGFALPATSLESLPWLRDALVGAGWVFPDADMLPPFGNTALLLCTSLLIIAWFAPNTQQIMRLYKPVIGSIDEVGKSHVAMVWQPTQLNATLTALLAAAAILSLQRASEFLYFQF